MNRYHRGFIASLMLLPLAAFGLPGESIALDPNTGNYRITYFGINESTGKRDVLRSAIFEPATKIEPTIRTSLTIAASGIVAYRYRIYNAATSRQPIVMVLFDPVAGLITTDSQSQLAATMASNSVAQNWGVASYPINSPSGWIGRVTASRKGKLRVGWDSGDGGVQPGLQLNGYGIFSTALPGIGIANIQGDSSLLEMADEGPIGEIGDQLDNLVKRDFVSRPAVVPTIAVPAPFDATVLLERIRAEMQTWPGKQLLDPAFAAQLDRYIVSAAEAFRLNDPKAAKEHIQTLRKILDKEHRGLENDDADDEDTEEHKQAARRSIDRLAARVLDFDLRYVLKRIEGGHEKGDGKKTLQAPFDKH